MGCVIAMRLMLPRFALIFASASLLLLAGCLSNTELRGIAVQLVEVKASPTTDGGAQLTLSIRYINENLVAIAASGARHKVTLNGVSLGRIDSEKPIGLPQHGTETLEYTLNVDAGTVTRLREMQAAGVANYALESSIRVLAGDEKLESRTSGSGSVAMANLGL
jgi:LEA14-like dessication related protein